MAENALLAVLCSPCFSRPGGPRQWAGTIFPVFIWFAGWLIAGQISPARAATGAIDVPGATPARAPSFVFILADDLGYGDLACFGHPRIRTPALDRLAAGGTQFRQFYVPHSVCSPSRVAAITGQYPSRWQTYAHFAWLADNARRGMPDWLDVGAPSLPRTLQQGGYRTALIGKWHLGGGSGRTFGGKAINSRAAPPVTAYGFDEARSIFGNGPTWLGSQPVDAPHEIYPYSDETWLTHSSRHLVDAGIQFLERHQRESAGRPFLLNLWLHDPHVPLRPDGEARAAYADIDDRGTQAYYAVVTEMDRQIGRFLARLDELGLRESTLVVFTSDNGTPAREGSLASAAGLDLATDTAGSNGPLRGWKWHLHEGGIRVPFIARWPGRIPAGRIDDASVLNLLDLMPTFTRLAGAQPSAGAPADGIDASPALFGQPFVRGQPMFWHNPTAARRGPPLAVRDGPWKLLMEPDGTLIELYNLDQDIAESTNLAATHPAIVDRLRALLRDWHRGLPPPLDRPTLTEAGRP